MIEKFHDTMSAMVRLSPEMGGDMTRSSNVQKPLVREKVESSDTGMCRSVIVVCGQVRSPISDANG